MAKRTKEQMSLKDKDDWNVLYEYVRSNVMGYDKNQSLSRNMVLRLKGLLNNKYMANNNIANTANYSYETVLNTFKYCMPNIQKGLRNNTFANENHKFSYILKIVESNINTVYMKMKNTKKTEEKIESIDTSAFEYQGAEYKPRGKVDDKFSDMW